MQSCAITTQSYLSRYYIRHSGRKWIRYYNRNRHHIPHPHGRAMGCLLWGSGRKLTALKRHRTERRWRSYIETQGTPPRLLHWPLYWHRLTLIPAGVSNYIVWDEITFGKGWIISPALYWACVYLFMLRLKLIRASERNPRCEIPNYRMEAIQMYELKLRYSDHGYKASGVMVYYLFDEYTLISWRLARHNRSSLVELDISIH